MNKVDSSTKSSPPKTESKPIEKKTSVTASQKTTPPTYKTGFDASSGAGAAQTPAKVTKVGGVDPAASTGATDAAITAQVTREVQQLASNGGDAAQIMSLAYERATELVRAQYPNMPVTERMDRAVAIATYSLNGPGYTDWLARCDSGQTNVVQYMRDIAANDPGLQAGGESALFAGHNLDSTRGRGTLYPSYNDNTHNQAFHTNFFVAAGYVAGGDPARMSVAQGLNVVHETVDPNAWAEGGGSVADYAASAAGILTGTQLFRAREYGQGYEQGEHPSGGNIDMLGPTIVKGFVSADGASPVVVDGMSQAQIDGAQQMMQQIAEYRGSFLFQLATEKNPVAGALVSFFGIPPWLSGHQDAPSPSR